MSDKNDKYPLISVIVPVYNSEKYVAKCLNSIIKQTYTNLEILIVLDGEMSDHSEEICYKYGQKDKRIRIKKISHSGIAEVRNIGIRECTGNIIGFVDSDDFIEETMYEKLFQYMKDKHADLVICSYFFERKKEVMIRGNLPDRVLNAPASLKLLAEERIQHYTWNKLYKKELFKGIVFPSGQIFEDVATMYKIIQKCDRIAICSVPLYHYISRPGSIISNRNLKGRLDAVEMQKKQYYFILEKYPTLERNMAKTIYRVYISLAASSVLSNYKERRKNVIRRKSLTNFFKKRKQVFKASLKKTQYFALKLTWMNSYFADINALVIEEWLRIYTNLFKNVKEKKGR